MTDGDEIITQLLTGTIKITLVYKANCCRQLLVSSLVFVAIFHHIPHQTVASSAYSYSLSLKAKANLVFFMYLPLIPCQSLYLDSP